MKKIIALIITLLLLFSCVCFTTTAAESECYFCADEPCECSKMYIVDKNKAITFSDDFTQLYLDDSTYSRFHDWQLYEEQQFSVLNTVTLTKEQEKSLLKYSMCTIKSGKIIWVQLSMNDGTVISATYMQDAIAEEYESLLNGRGNSYTINFMYPEGNTVTTDIYALSGKKETINFDYMQDQTFEVIVYSEDKSYGIYKGELVLYNDEYYYVDCAENGYLYPGNCPFDKNLEVYKITDKMLIESIENSMKSYYEDDFGFFYDDTFTKGVADTFLLIVFAIIPFAVLVIFAVVAIRSKGIYRKMGIIISAISALELIIFAIITTLVT